VSLNFNKINIYTINQIKIKKMKNQYHYIIDKSGSMSDCQAKTVNCLNEQFTSLQRLALDEKKQEFRASLHFFNSSLQTIINEQNPMNLSKLQLNDFCPSGSTSLFDAIGIIASAERLKSSEGVKSGQKKVVFVIITDGYENSSQLFNFENIRKLISEMQNEGYIFMFLGAIPNAKVVATNISIKDERAHSFHKKDMDTVFKKMGDSLSDLAKNKTNWNKF
jgi:Mg-chelatase subunit ChlD